MLLAMSIHKWYPFIITAVKAWRLIIQLLYLAIDLQGLSPLLSSARTPLHHPLPRALSEPPSPLLKLRGHSMHSCGRRLQGLVVFLSVFPISAWTLWRHRLYLTHFCVHHYEHSLWHIVFNLLNSTRTSMPL